MPNPSSVVPTSHTADGLVSTGRTLVHWVTHQAGATGGAWQLNDSTDDSGTDLLPGTTAASTGPATIHFDPPILFKLGLYADIPGTNVTLTIGWS